MTQFGNSPPTKPPFVRPQPPKGPLLSELAGMSEARQWGESLARDIALCLKGKIAWKDIDPGCVLFGPPGTGKTTYAKALAATTRLPLIASSYADWQSAGEGHLGTTLAAMKEAFSNAKTSAPCIFFIDELDSVPTRGGGSALGSYWNAVVNALLKEFDGLNDVSGVIVIGACNHPEMLDPALVRSGRMDRSIGIPLPTTKELEGIIKFHLKGDERFYFDDAAVRSLSLLCAGMSGADVAKTVRNARQHARNANRYLSKDDFKEVLDPPSKRQSAQTRIRVAVHETGHVVAALRLGVSSDITASVISNDSSYGRICLRANTQPLTEKSIGDLIVVVLAGRAAEEVVLGEVSALAGGNTKDNDLAQANRLASDAVAKLGFSKQAGLLWHGSSHQDNILLGTGPLSAEIRSMLDAAYARAKHLIQSEKRLFESLAEALYRNRVLSYDEIRALDKGFQLPPQPRPVPPARPVRPILYPPNASPALRQKVDQNRK